MRKRVLRALPPDSPPIYWKGKLEFLTMGSTQGRREHKRKGPQPACHYGQTACGLQFARNGNSLLPNENVKVISTEPAEPDAAPYASDCRDKTYRIDSNYLKKYAPPGIKASEL